MTRSVLLLCMACLLAGCAMFGGGGPKPVKLGWDSLALMAADDANANSALAVDIVLVRDQGLLDSLLAMPAAKYFAGRSALQRTFPDGMTVLSFEIVPDQALRVAPALYRKEKVLGALAFANYAAPGEHRARLLPGRSAYVLRLETQGFAVADGHAGPAR